MEAWFQVYSDHPFQLFGKSHIIVFFVFFIGTLLIVASSIKNRPALHLFIRTLLFVLLFVSEGSYQYWAVTNGVWETATYLPLHLCGVASILGMITLLTLSPKLIKLNYFIGIVPAFIALVTPDLLYDYQHFRFWKFFLHHMAIPWTSLFLVLITPVRITWKSMWKAYGWLIVYACITAGFNLILNSNYMYLDSPPAEGTLLDYMGEGLWYYVNLGLVSLLIFSTLVLFYKRFEK